MTKAQDFFEATRSAIADLLSDKKPKPTQLDRVERTLKRMEDTMSSQEQVLDQALAELDTKLDALKADVEKLIAAIPPEVDLSDEIAAVQGRLDEVGGIQTTVQGATPPPPPE